MNRTKTVRPATPPHRLNAIMRHWPYRGLRLALHTSLALAALGAATEFSGSAYAADFQVTNGNASGAGSLAQAIADLNASTDATNTITFASSVGSTITLTSQLPNIAKSVVFVTPASGLTLLGQTAVPSPSSGLGKYFILPTNNGVAVTIPSTLRLAGGNTATNGFNNSTGIGAFVTTTRVDPTLTFGAGSLDIVVDVDSSRSDAVAVQARSVTFEGGMAGRIRARGLDFGSGSIQSTSANALGVEDGITVGSATARGGLTGEIRASATGSANAIAHGGPFTDGGFVIHGDLAGSIVAESDDDAAAIFSRGLLHITGSLTKDGSIRATSSGGFLPLIAGQQGGKLQIDGDLAGTISAISTATSGSVHSVRAINNFGVTIGGDLSGTVEASTAVQSSSSNHGILIGGNSGDPTLNLNIGGAITSTGVVRATAGSGSVEAVSVFQGRVAVGGAVDGKILAQTGGGEAIGILGNEIAIGGGIGGRIEAQANTVSARDTATAIWSRTTTNIQGGIRVLNADSGIVANAGTGARAWAIRTDRGLTIDGGIAAPVTATAGTDDAIAVRSLRDIRIAGGISGRVQATAGGANAFGLYARYDDSSAPFQGGVIDGGAADTPLTIAAGGEVGAQANGLAVAVAGSRDVNLRVAAGGKLTGVDTGGSGNGYALRMGYLPDSGAWRLPPVAAGGVAPTALLDNGGQIVGRVSFDGANAATSRYTFRSGASQSGLVELAGATLAVESASGGVAEVAAATFTGSPRIELNSETGSTGRIRLAAASAPATTATLDTGGGAGTTATLHRGELNLAASGSSLRAETVAIAAGATLSGVGTVYNGPGTSGGGATTIDGNLNPGNSAGTIGFDRLILGATSRLNFELTAPGTGPAVGNDLVSVNQSVTVGGTLAVAPLATLAAGTYTLIDYGSTASGGFASVLGLDDYSYSIVDNLSATRVDLNIAGASAIGRYWDGSNNSAGGVALGRGGNGVWNATNTNWTTIDGGSNNAWPQDRTAVFAGQSGTVDVVGEQAATGLDFRTGDYLLRGGSIRLLGSVAAVSVGDGLTATVASTLTQAAGAASGLDKVGAGTLVLTGANSYGGGTAITAGTLAIGSSTALGSGAVVVGNNATLRAAADGLTPANAVSVPAAGAVGTVDTQAFGLSLASAIGGAGTVRKTGTGTLTLAAGGTPNGVNIAQGTLANLADLTATAGIAMGSGTRLDNLAGTTRTATLAGGTIVGDAGSQWINNVSATAANGATVVRLATISNAIDLGDGNDRVTNRFASFTNTIGLGRGDDTLEIYLSPVDGSVGGSFAAQVDGGAGFDTIQYSLASGQVTLNQRPSLVGGPFLSFEGLAKGGAGNLIFNFTFDATATPQRVGFEGPAELRQPLTVATVPGDPLSGVLTLKENVDAATVLKNANALTVERRIDLIGRTTFDNLAGASTTVAAGAGSIVGDDGAQTIDNAGSIDATVALAGGNDRYTLRASGTQTRNVDGGAGSNQLQIETAAGATRTLGAGAFVNFGTIDLNQETANTGKFVVQGGRGLDAGASGGSITLYRGELNLNDAPSAVRAATTTIAAGATISGNGTVEGQGRVDGTLRPGNSVGRLTFASLSLSGSSVLDYELGRANVPNTPDPLNDLVIVNGNLTLDGALTVAQSAGGNFTAGVYRLINYGGSLTNNTLDIASLPNGLAGTIQTALPGVVNLIVSSGGGGGVDVLYWDGANTTANGRIDGGSGIWNGSLTNWTDNGADNGPWDNDVGVFAGAAGIVAVEGRQRFNVLQFATDGYRVTAGSLGIDGANAIAVEENVTARIESLLDGAGSLNKQGAGRLVLTGNNSYSGGTAISAGTLGAGSATAFGTGAVDIRNGATLQAAVGGLTLANAVGVSGAVGTVDTQGFELTLSTAVAGTGTLRKTGSGGTLTLGAGGSLGGVDLAQGTLVNRGALTTSTFAMGGDTRLDNAAAASIAVAAGAGSIVGDDGAQTIDNAGSIDATVALAGGNDRYTLRASGTQTGNVDGGAGSNQLQIETAAGATRTLTEGSFTNFQTVALNADSGNSGRFAIAAAAAPANVATLDTGGAAGSSIVLGRGELNLTTANSSIRAATVTIASGATLSGNGTVFNGAGAAGGGQTLIDGTVAPGNGGIGTLRVAGNFSQGAGSAYQVEYRAPAPGVAPVAGGDNDLIAVAGSATIAGSARLQLVALSPQAAYETARTAAANPTPGQLRYTILTTTGGVAGQYAALGIPNVSVEKVNQDRDLQLVLRGDDSGGGGILVGQAPAQLGLVLPQDPSYGCRGSLIGGNTNTNEVGDRTNCMWLNPFAVRGRVDTVTGGGAAAPYTIAGADYTTGGVGVGGDRAIDGNWSVGGGLTFADTDADYSIGSGSQQTRGYQVVAYGAYTQGAWETAIYGGYGYYTVDGSRPTGLAATPTANSAYRMQQFRVGAVARYLLPLDAQWALLPQAGLSWQPLRRAGYTETGGGDANFRADASTWNAGTATLGATLRFAPAAVEGLTAELGALWQAVLGDTGMSLTGTYQGAPSTVFGTGSDPYPRSAALLRANLGYRQSDTTTIGLAYSGRYNGTTNESQFNLNFKWTF